MSNEAAQTDHVNAITTQGYSRYLFFTPNHLSWYVIWFWYRSAAQVGIKCCIYLKEKSVTVYFNTDNALKYMLFVLSKFLCLPYLLSFCFILFESIILFTARTNYASMTILMQQHCNTLKKLFPILTTDDVICT